MNLISDRDNISSLHFSVYDIYMPKHAQGPVSPHTIVTLPNTNGMQLLLCYDNEGVYVNTYGKVSIKHPMQCSQYFEPSTASLRLTSV